MIEQYAELYRYLWFDWTHGVSGWHLYFICYGAALLLGLVILIWDSKNISTDDIMGWIFSSMLLCVPVCILTYVIAFIAIPAGLVGWGLYSIVNFFWTRLRAKSLGCKCAVCSAPRCECSACQVERGNAHFRSLQARISEEFRYK